MKEKHRGAHSELLARAWLLEQGYDVFVNVSPFGEIDLIAYKDGQFTLVDVKSARSDGGGGRRLSDGQKQMGVRKLCVSEERVWFAGDRWGNNQYSTREQ